MNDRARIILLAVIMTTVSLMVGGIALAALYGTAIDEQRERLIETAQSHARLMEAVARFDMQYSSQHVPGGAFAATLSQIRDAHERFRGFGETGEFTLARLEDDQIVFLLRHRHFDLANPRPVPVNSDIAEPMRRALLGESGSLVGLDYRGAKVLAAYEPVSELDLGIVAKIDLAEIRAPFVRAALVAAATVVVLVSIATVVFLRISSPLVRHIEDNERKYRALFEHANDSIFIIDPATRRFLDVNELAASRLGYTREELLQSTIDDIHAPESATYNEAIIRQLLAAGQVVVEHTHLRKDGAEMPVEISGQVVEYGGQRVLQAIVRDITERKRAQDALQRGHDELEMRVRDRTAELTQANAKLRGEIEERRQVEERLSGKHHLLDAIGRAQSQFIRNRGPRVVFDSLLTTVLSLTQSEYGFIGEVLHRPDGTPYLKTHAITDIAWNEKTQRFYREHADRGLEFTNLETLYGAVITTGRPVISNEPGVDPRSGGVPEGHPPLDAFLGVPFFLGERLLGMVGVANRPDGYDEELVEYLQPFLATCSHIIQAHRIDQRRMEAEHDLQTSQEFLNDLMDAVADPIFTVAMPERRIEYVNDAVRHMFGYEPGEVIGQTTRLLYHDDASFDSSSQRLQAAQAERLHRFQQEQPLRRKDGSSIWAELNTTIVQQEGGSLRVISVVRDITERKRAEKELKMSREKLRALAANLQRVREEERTAIARDLHDDLGQILVGTKMEIAAAQHQIASLDAQAAASLDSVLRLVDLAIDSGRRITSRLRPEILDHLGLADAIEWQANEFVARSGIECRLQLSSDNLDLDDERATALFRIFQEMLTNVTRHADASRVDIHLAETDGYVELEVRDNGRGVREGDLEKPTSFGVLGMKERVAVLGGTAEISGVPDEGTTVRVRIANVG